MQFHLPMQQAFPAPECSAPFASIWLVFLPSQQSHDHDRFLIGGQRARVLVAGAVHVIRRGHAVAGRGWVLCSSPLTLHWVPWFLLLHLFVFLGRTVAHYFESLVFLPIQFSILQSAFLVRDWILYSIQALIEGYWSRTADRRVDHRVRVHSTLWLSNEQLVSLCLLDESSAWLDRWIISLLAVRRVFLGEGRRWYGSGWTHPRDPVHHWNLSWPMMWLVT